MTKTNRHVSSSLDNMLAKDGMLEAVSARAIKRVSAWQSQKHMKKKGVSKATTPS